MRAVPLALFLALAALPGMAETPMTGLEFEAYTTGKTMTYARSGAVWGTEEYLPGRRVRWAFAEGACEVGRWYEEGPWICFSYETGPEPQCWQFFRGETGLRARFRGDPPELDLSEVARTTEPLACPGPDVGA